MAQFDVYRSPVRMRQRAPFLVVVQSARLDRLRTRVVIPLIDARVSTDGEAALAPSLMVEGRALVLAPWEIFTIQATALTAVIASFAADSSAVQVIRAIDELITRAYG